MPWHSVLGLPIGRLLPGDYPVGCHTACHQRLNGNIPVGEMIHGTIHMVQGVNLILQLRILAADWQGLQHPEAFPPLTACTTCMAMCLSGAVDGIRSTMLDAGYRTLKDLLLVNFVPCGVVAGEARIPNAGLLIAEVRRPPMPMTKLVFELFFAGTNNWL